jgi:fructose-1-phosphate kinase PfkB-like protein
MSKNAVSRILNPWGIPEKVTGFVNQQQASVLQKELSRSLPIYRERFGEETKLSPENLKESERLNNLAKQIEALGIEPKY